MDPSFRHGDVFPLIARVITRLPGDALGYVNHKAIVTAILADPEGAGIVARARAAGGWNDDRVASNMVAWFSQQITVANSPWEAFFDRKKQGGTWAYRPKTAIAPPIAPDPELSAIEGDPRLFLPHPPGTQPRPCTREARGDAPPRWATDVRSLRFPDTSSLSRSFW